jgi:hypothetical protein
MEVVLVEDKEAEGRIRRRENTGDEQVHFGAHSSAKMNLCKFFFVKLIAWISTTPGTVKISLRHVTVGGIAAS